MENTTCALTEEYPVAYMETKDYFDKNKSKQKSDSGLYKIEWCIRHRDEKYVKELRGKSPKQQIKIILEMDKNQAEVDDSFSIFEHPSDEVCLGG